VTAPDVIDAPAELQRRDGSSVYDPARPAALGAQGHARPGGLAARRRRRADRPHTRRDVIEAAIVEHDLGGDQAARSASCSAPDRRIGLLVGPAGAGKTRTLRAVVAAWQHTAATCSA
jgi:ATPase subunit of ABC transporter with duplicated ATPase domains